MAKSRFIAGYLAFMALLIVSSGQGYDDAHATFYGDIKGVGTMEGACGYGNLWEQGYGLETTALSTVLFDNGYTCGACFEIFCTNSQWCKPGNIRVTATNFCPPSTGSAAWCNPPLKHFDLTEPMFLNIAEYKAGIVPVKFRRVACIKKGGVKFQLKGNPSNWLLVLVFNVGGAGNVVNMKVKGQNNNWVQMTRNWGMNWQAGGSWQGQGMSFQVTTSDGKTIEADNVVPSSWQLWQTFEAKTNF
ncbi:hypothetical protein Nepgr_005766 [Nepenthes gracilis]|uniref:Expansin n=1 Tax=Nepenthes gracilis TaxID=150966 RepID=A0AAD3XGR5_NEPGR|nr:hypothetical protein Nepgr_005766 [Nepenthes gracilis]